MHTKKPKKFTHVKIEVGLYKALQKTAKKYGVSMGTLIKNDYEHCNVCEPSNPSLK